MHGVVRDGADLVRHLVEGGRGQSEAVLREGVADEGDVDIVGVERPCGGEVACRAYK